MVQLDKPVPATAEGVTKYPPPEAVVADKPAAFGVKVTVATASLFTNPEVLKFVALKVTTLKAVPYSFVGPVAVTSKAFAFTVNVPLA